MNLASPLFVRRLQRGIIGTRDNCDRPKYEPVSKCLNFYPVNSGDAAVVVRIKKMVSSHFFQYRCNSKQSQVKDFQVSEYRPKKRKYIYP